MASSQYTTRLGLCDWAGSDRPKRADFVSDNNIIDSVLGGHVASSSIHLSSADRDKLTYPFENVNYAGTGESARSINVGFRPTAAIVYKRDAAPVEYTGGVNVINSAFATYASGESTGLSINSQGVEVAQQAEAVNGKRISLNETGCQYTVIAFK